MGEALEEWMTTTKTTTKDDDDDDENKKKTKKRILRERCRFSRRKSHRRRCIWKLLVEQAVEKILLDSRILRRLT